MNLALNRIESDWVVGRIWSEDRDGIARTECINGGLVSIRVTLVVRREGVE